MKKFSEVIDSLKEARSLAHYLLFANPAPKPETTSHFLNLLDRIQSLVISIRADFIELFYSRAGGGRTNAPNGLNPTQGPGSKVIVFDRRRAGQDRRRVHTYIGCDRRSGIADRRRKVARKI
jgi:hypothetical protein